MPSPGVLRLEQDQPAQPNQGLIIMLRDAGGEPGPGGVADDATLIASRCPAETRAVPLHVCGGPVTFDSYTLQGVRVRPHRARRRPGRPSARPCRPPS